MVDLSGEGTPEHAWQSWPGLASRPKLRMPAPPATAVVIAPHPTMRCWASAGCSRCWPVRAPPCTSSPSPTGRPPTRVADAFAARARRPPHRGE